MFSLFFFVPTIKDKRITSHLDYQIYNFFSQTSPEWVILTKYLSFTWQGEGGRHPLALLMAVHHLRFPTYLRLYQRAEAKISHTLTTFIICTISLDIYTVTHGSGKVVKATTKNLNWPAGQEGEKFRRDSGAFSLLEGTNLQLSHKYYVSVEWKQDSFVRLQTKQVAKPRKGSPDWFRVPGWMGFWSTGRCPPPTAGGQQLEDP